jgi:hypothetical protein
MTRTGFGIWDRVTAAQVDDRITLGSENENRNNRSKICSSGSISTILIHSLSTLDNSSGLRNRDGWDPMCKETFPGDYSYLRVSNGWMIPRGFEGFRPRYVLFEHQLKTGFLLVSADVAHLTAIVGSWFCGDYDFHVCPHICKVM